MVRVAHEARVQQLRTRGTVDRVGECRGLAPEGEPVKDKTICQTKSSSLLVETTIHVKESQIGRRNVDGVPER